MVTDSELINFSCRLFHARFWKVFKRQASASSATECLGEISLYFINDVNIFNQIWRQN